MIRFIPLILTLFIFVGCDRNKNGDPHLNTNAKGSAEEIFSEAQRLRNNHRYNDAAIQFAEVERQYPLNSLAVTAQYERAVTFYEAQKYSDAIRAFDRFLSFNPGHQLEVKAVYLRALSFYNEIPDVFRDQGITKNAQVALMDLVARFPNTAEAKDSKQKLILVLDQLAGHEMVVGRTYINQNRYLAAQNRFKEVIETYPTTGQVPEAFYRLVETSLALGLNGEARRYGATLGHNFPANAWYHKAYKLLTGS